MPHISVIVPTFNRANFIKETLESVLAQTYTDYEVIVIDDGSTDNTEEIMSSFLADHPQIRYIKQANAGVSAARNHGIFEAQGEWIAFLDSDDLWFPDKLEKQMAFLAEHPTAGAVSNRAYVYQEGKVVNDKKGEPISPWEKRETSVLSVELFSVSHLVWTSSVLVKKTVLYKAGLFDSSLKIAEDFDLWLRIARNCEFWLIGEVMGYYRIHETNITKDYAETLYRTCQVQKLQMVRWCDEPHLVKHFEEWIYKKIHAKFFHNAYLADVNRQEQNYKDSARYYWSAVYHAPNLILKGCFWSKFLIAKFCPFVFWIWDKLHKS